METYLNAEWRREKDIPVGYFCLDVIRLLLVMTSAPQEREPPHVCVSCGFQISHHHSPIWNIIAIVGSVPTMDSVSPPCGRPPALPDAGQVPARLSHDGRRTGYNP